MKALAIVDRFGVENLAWIERDRPEPGPGEVVVRIAAVSLNHRDLEIVEGRRKVALPLIPISDGAGVVIGVGAGVTTLAPGDRVMPTFVQGWLSGPQPPGEVLPTLGGPLDGVLAELGVWPETGLVRIPQGMSERDAATLPCAAVSAWNALFEAGNVRPGETVLVQGTGGVALFALQFARLAGARVFVISSSDEKIERARTLGAHEGINYLRYPDWGARARDMTEAGIDHVIEVGGERTFAQSVAALANGGHIRHVGSLSGASPAFNVGELGRKSVRISGIRVGPRDSFERMCRAIAAHGLAPVVDSEYDMTGIAAAFARLKSGAHFGKICVALRRE